MDRLRPFHCFVFLFVVYATIFYRAVRDAIRRARLCHSIRRRSARLSVRLSVTLRYVFRTGWNTSKITSRPNSLRYLA